MVALHFDHAILDGATRTALAAQLLTQERQHHGVQRQAFHHGDAHATPSLGLARHTHLAVTDRCSLGVGLAYTLRYRLAAVWAHATRFSGIDETAQGTAFHDEERIKGKAAIVAS